MGACSSCSKAERATRPPQEELELFHHFVTDVVMGRETHHSLKDAFVKLGGGDDDKIHRGEMIAKMKSLQYAGDAEFIFDLLDCDNEGHITKDEFINSTKKDFLDSGVMRGFNRFVIENFGNLDNAFDSMDHGIAKDRKSKAKAGDKALYLDEFQAVLSAMGYTGDSGVVYRLLDKNCDGAVVISEFKAKLKNIKIKK